MKEYTVFDGVSVGAGATETRSIDLENTGLDLNYALAIKGGIASADVAVNVEIPGDTEVYDTALKGQNQLSGIDLTDGGEFRSLEHTPELSAMRAAETVHISVTNNDGSSATVTVKILQYSNN